MAVFMNLPRASNIYLEIWRVGLDANFDMIGFKIHVDLFAFDPRWYLNVNVHVVQSLLPLVHNLILVPELMSHLPKSGTPATRYSRRCKI